jgi:hypothetical protein
LTGRCNKRVFVVFFLLIYFFILFFLQYSTGIVFLILGRFVAAWEPKPSRMLNLEITDGFQTIRAVERQPVGQQTYWQIFLPYLDLNLFSLCAALIFLPQHLQLFAVIFICFIFCFFCLLHYFCRRN